MGLNTTEVPGSLRQRKKLSTHALLRKTALKLFRERGFAAVTVDEIAIEAGVSRSTFFRYFGSKEAVLFNEVDETGDVFLRELRQRPSSETPWEAFAAALLATSQDAIDRRNPDEQRAIDELLRNDPALSGRRLAEQTRWTDLIANAFATRSGRATPILADRLAAATCMALSEEVGRVWRADATVDPATIVPEAFAILRTF